MILIIFKIFKNKYVELYSAIQLNDVIFDISANKYCDRGNHISCYVQLYYCLPFYYNHNIIHILLYVALK